jgi:hypothetical protein
VPDEIVIDELMKLLKVKSDVAIDITSETDLGWIPKESQSRSPL